MSPAFQYRLRTARPLVCVEDYRRAALRALPKMVWAYLDGGAEDERTLRANRDAFSKWVLRQRVLAGNAEIDTSVTLDGEQLALPVLLAPTGLAGLAHWSGRARRRPRRRACRHPVDPQHGIVLFDRGGGCGHRRRSLVPAVPVG